VFELCGESQPGQQCRRAAAKLDSEKAAGCNDLRWFRESPTIHQQRSSQASRAWFHL